MFDDQRAHDVHNAGRRHSRVERRARGQRRHSESDATTSDSSSPNAASSLDEKSTEPSSTFAVIAVCIVLLGYSIYHQSTSQRSSEESAVNVLASIDESRLRKLRTIADTLLDYDSDTYWFEDVPSPVKRLDESIPEWREELATSAGTHVLIKTAGTSDPRLLFNCAVCIGKNELKTEQCARFLLHCLQFKFTSTNFTKNAEQRAALVRATCYAIARTGISSPEITLELVKVGNPPGSEMASMRSLLALYYTGHTIQPETVAKLRAYSARLSNSTQDAIADPQVSGQTLADHVLTKFLLKEILQDSEERRSERNVSLEYSTFILQELAAESRRWQNGSIEDQAYSAAISVFKTQQMHWELAMSRPLAWRN